MRIALFCPSFGEVGGIETIAASLIAEFRKAGHAVTVLARGEPSVELADGVKVVRVDYHQVPRRARHLARHIRFVSGYRPAVTVLRQALESFRADAVLSLAVTTYSPYVAALARTAPVVMSLQGGEAGGEFASRPRLLRWALRRAQRVVACASSLAASARALAPEVASRVSVIPNGVDPGRFTEAGPSYPHPRPYVVAVGRLVRQKGFDVLLDAFGKLRATNAGIDLLIAGEGPERRDLEAQCARLGLAERVLFLGVADPATVTALYRGALFVACPSRWEGLPVVCLEAMASGRAVIAAAVDGVPDAVAHGETGVLIPPEDAPSLAATMKALVDDPERCRTLGARGCAVARERFAWPVVAGCYLGVLEDASRETPSDGGRISF